MWAAARGILYPQRKPHPEASGERLFVVLTCEALLVERILVLSLAFKAKLNRDSNFKSRFSCLALSVPQSHKTVAFLECHVFSHV